MPDLTIRAQQLLFKINQFSYFTNRVWNHYFFDDFRVKIQNLVEYDVGRSIVLPGVWLMKWDSKLKLTLRRLKVWLSSASPRVSRYCSSRLTKIIKHLFTISLREENDNPHSSQAFFTSGNNFQVNSFHSSRWNNERFLWTSSCLIRKKRCEEVWVDSQWSHLCVSWNIITFYNLISKDVSGKCWLSILPNGKLTHPWLKMHRLQFSR